MEWPRLLVIAPALFVTACGDSSFTDAEVFDVPLPRRDARHDSSRDLAMNDAVPTDGMAGDSGSGDASADAASDVTRDVIPCGTCTDYGALTVRGHVAPPEINEPSGIATSRNNPGVLYVENDSGDIARFFALTESGEFIGDFRLSGSVMSDWEDMSIGPCPAGSCIFLGDIGDNRINRTEYQVYRVPEPDLPGASPVGTRNVTFDRFPFVYPGNTSYNSETLMVHPQTGEIYVVTKAFDGLSTVFKLPMPLMADVRVTAIQVGQIQISMVGGSMLQVTGGDIHPCGSRFMLRVYDRLFEFRSATPTPFESLLTVTPVLVPVAMELKGEAVAYRADGHGYFTLSEGANQALNYVECR